MLLVAPGGFTSSVHSKGDLGADVAKELPKVESKDIRGPRR
jgi:hypothetical protein